MIDKKLKVFGCGERGQQKAEQGRRGGGGGDT